MTDKTDAPMPDECRPPEGTPDGTVCVLTYGKTQKKIKWRTRYGDKRWVSLVSGITNSPGVMGAAGWRFHSIAEIDTLRASLAAATAREGRLREAALDALAHLVAAHSLLKSGGKKAAPSDRMFEQMLIDYQNSIDRIRAALKDPHHD